MFFLSCNRMIEGELPGVEHEARGGDLVFFPINGVAKDWGAFVVEVDADLVCAACVEVTEDEGGFCGGICGEDLVVSDRGFSSGWIHDGHFLAVDRVPADVGEDGVFLWGGDAVGDGEVELFHRGALGKLGDESLVGGVCFCNDQAAGGILVETVYDAGALDSADAGELAFAMVEQRID